MRFHKELYLVILGTFLYFNHVLNERRELAGYNFPVYSTSFCPSNKSEWDKRSSALNCSEKRGYTCLPNQQLTELLEFCYTQPRILIEAGTCLYLVKRVSRVNGHNCQHFSYGCHNVHFLSDRIYEYPACISLGNGCFLAEPSCKRSINIREDSTITYVYPQQSTDQTHAENPSTNDKEKDALPAILLGTIIPICMLSVMCSCYVFHKRKFQICRSHGDVETSEVEKLAQSTKQHELNYIDTIDTEFSFIKQKHVFVSHKDEEIETLICESQHADENFERHEVEMLTPLLDNNKITTCQKSVFYRRKSSLENEDQKLNPLINDQHTDWNAENHDGEMFTLPIGKNKNTTYLAGIQECRRNGEKGLSVLKPTQCLENYQLNTALIEEAICTYKKNSTTHRNEDEKVKLLFDHNQLISRNAENHEEEMLNKNKNMIYQAFCTYKKNSTTHRNEDEKVKLLFDHYQLIGRNAENHEEEMLNKNKNMIYQESPIEKAILDNWNHEDSCFVFTKACGEVEKLIKSKNLVIVAGHTGSGKSAIIHHIALQYRKLDWKVKRVKEVKDIVDEYCSSPFQKHKTLCIFNDPIGKESFDEMLNYSWQTYEEELKSFLKTSKLMMSCRSHIIHDTRVTRYLVNQSDIIDIDNDKNKLSINEKRQILTKYTSNMNLSDNECDQIVKVEKYFPLLCKLYSKIHNSKKHDLGFFTEPRKTLETDIRGFRKKDKGKYCALVLLVLFNNDLCLSYLLKYTEIETKYNHSLKLCGLPESTPPSEIKDSLDSLNGFFVKKVGDTYHFNHDFVMEVTAHVFGKDYPADIIKYADIGFLRRRVTLENCNQQNDAFVIQLTDRYAEELAKRFFFEMIGRRFLDVVLNPCLRNENVIKAMRQMIQNFPVHLSLMPLVWSIEIDTEEFNPTSKGLLLSKLSFLKLQKIISPLFALIVFCHNELSMHCLNTLQQMQPNINTNFLFPAVCCNGTMNMFEMFPEKNMTTEWSFLYPIHIVSVFHNYEMLEKLIENGADVNLKIDAYDGVTPLILASGNDCSENEIYNIGISSETRRNKTVQVLLKSGADITLCTKNGLSPLYLACQNGHDSTVQLLLSKGADINLCSEEGASPLFIACQNGHDSTVQLLLDNKAAINLCLKDGTSPLFVSCQQNHYSNVQLLLRYGADIHLCREGGASPLHIACHQGQDIIVQLLLNNGANINLCTADGHNALYIACRNGHDSTAKLLLSKEADIHSCAKDGTSPLFAACYFGYEKTVQVLLCNKADVNLCTEHGESPLYLACKNGHEGIVQLLLSNGADITFNKKDGASPLYAACQNGHEIIAQLLLSIGADINLCENNNRSPLYVACCNGYLDIVQILLSEGADINLVSEDGTSPLFVACISGHDNIVEFLINKGANVNLCTKDGTSPLFAACCTKHDSIAQYLLNNGADVNLCNNDGIYPLHIACFNSQEGTVKLLIDNLADVNLCMKDGISPLHVACEEGNVGTVQLLITKGADINECSDDGTSPLLAACLSKQYNILQLLLQNGAVTNLTKNGTGPLYVACSNGHDEVAHLLLNNGADINCCTKDGSSPLYVACSNGHNSIVQLLLDNGADINLFKKDGHGPLYAACLSGHENTAQLLLNNGANINEGRATGESLLHWACCLGYDAIVQLLLRNGAKINLCEESKESPICSDCYRRHDSIPSPLYGACVKGQFSTAQLLINMGADINLCLEDGISPLFAACKNKNDKIVQLLLSNGADVNLSRRDGCSPLHEACKTGHDIIVQLLLKNKANVNFFDTQYIVSPLFIACFHGYDRIVEMLLNNGAEINSCITDGTCPLYIACCQGHNKTVQLLLNNGADINLSKDGAASSLFVACQNRYDSIVELLLRNGADINLFDRNRASPLFVACLKAHESTVQILLKNGADINFCLTNGVSPLFSACSEGHNNIVQLLLHNGADINLCDNAGLSPLYVACLWGHDSTVQLLLSNGADINLRMKDRVSPLYIAFETRRYKTVSILLTNGVVNNLDCGWEINPALVGCFDENDRTVKFLRQNDNILSNIYDLDSYFSLFVSCQVERVTRIIFDQS